MGNWSIKMKLVGSFAIILICMVFLGIYSLYSLSTVNNKTVEITGNWMTGINLLNDIVDSANTVRRKEFNHLVLTDPKLMDEVERMKEEEELKVMASIAEYEKLIDQTTYESQAEKDKDLGAIREIQKQWENYAALSDEVVRLSRAGQQGAGAQLALGQSLDCFAKLTELLDQSILFNRESANQVTKESAEIYSSTRLITIVVLVLAVLLGVAISYLLIANLKKSIDELSRVSEAVGRGNLNAQVKIYANDELGALSVHYNNTIRNMKELIRQIQNTAEQVAASSEELTASADQSAQVTQQIAQNISSVSGEADRQLKEVENAAMVVQRISARVEQTATNANNSAANAASEVEQSKKGGVVIDKAVEQMKSIEETVNNSASLVTTLGERSKEIGQIVETISGIAGQTNLLALNAAIEAARAGEQGKGFAVVAEEVRKLAEQSEEATERIAVLIKSIQDETEKAVAAMHEGTVEVKNGSEVVSQGGEAFKVLAEMSVGISKQAQEISEAMQEMSSGMSQIVHNTENIDSASRNITSESQTVAAATEEQSASMQQIASSSQSLAKLAQELQNATHRFTV